MAFTRFSAVVTSPRLAYATLLESERDCDRERPPESERDRLRLVGCLAKSQALCGAQFE